jgi:protoheme IX farnesyltransferase
MYALALLPVSLAPTFSGIAGWTYLALALPLGAALVVLAAQFAHRRSARTARLLFLGSITYLPLVWASMILDH